MPISLRGRTFWSMINGFGLQVTLVAGLTITLSQALPLAAAETDNPLLATYDGGSISLDLLEEFAREMPISQRIPFANGAGDWRRFICGELAQSVTLTSQALQMGLHQNPGYLRARDYFIQEYLCYLVMRDKLTNVMDISPEKQRQQYKTNLADYWLSPTATMRVIRTRDLNKISSAAVALESGSDFLKVEMEFSQVSPRYRGQLVGPFPSTQERTTIPPPDEVINAALAIDEGQTTGPMEVGGFHFIVKNERKTAGRQQSLYEVAERVEERLREAESGVLLPELIDQIQKELGVEVDEALFSASNTKPDDLLATVGALKIYRQEFTELNGNVRGPAGPVAGMMPTRLKGFVLPYMMAQWAKVHGYMDREETRKALYYYDLQHLAGKVAMDISEQLAPSPTDEQLRATFQKNIAEYRRTGAPEPRFEDHRDDLLNIQMQERAPNVERQVRKAVLSRINFKLTDAPRSTDITALEALSTAGDRLSSGIRLLRIAPVQLMSDASGATSYEDIGRAPEWRISFDTGFETSTSEMLVKGPAPLLTNDDSYSSVPAFRRWPKLLQFDTDALKRHAIDKGIGDFMAKHDNKVHVVAAVDFSYSDDDPTSPGDCLITYTATPVGAPAAEAFVIRYAGDDGEITKRRLGEVEQICQTCPSPGTATPRDHSNSETTSSTLPLQKGDL